MNRTMRWLRGAIGTGATWALLWTLVGTGIALALKVWQPDDFDQGETLTRAIQIFATIGFLSGIGFASVFSIVERRRELNQLSLVRTAMWGAIGSAAIPLLMGANSNQAFITAPLGAVFAVTTLMLARRASNQDNQLPPNSGAEQKKLSSGMFSWASWSRKHKEQSERGREFTFQPAQP